MKGQTVTLEVQLLNTTCKDCTQHFSHIVKEGMPEEKPLCGLFQQQHKPLSRSAILT